MAIFLCQAEKDRHVSTVLLTPYSWVYSKERIRNFQRIWFPVKQLEKMSYRRYKQELIRTLPPYSFVAPYNDRLRSETNLEAM